MTDWRERAACKGDPDPDAWFVEWHHARDNPTVRARLMHAIDTCNRCPVREECLDWADANPSLAYTGTFGGLTYRQRENLKRRGVPYPSDITPCGCGAEGCDLPVGDPHHGQPGGRHRGCVCSPCGQAWQEHQARRREDERQQRLEMSA